MTREEAERIEAAVRLMGEADADEARADEARADAGAFIAAKRRRALALLNGEPAAPGLSWVPIAEHAKATGWHRETMTRRAIEHGATKMHGKIRYVDISNAAFVAATPTKK